MKRFMLLVVVCLVILVLSTPVSAQVCGDANGDQQVNLSDMVLIISYLTALGPPDIPNEAGADCDGRSGITVGDVTKLSRFFFIDFEEPQCPPTLTYTYAAAPNDTIFIPHWANIPASVDRIEVPIITNFSPNTISVYFCLLEASMGPDAVFEIDSIFIASSDVFGAANADLPGPSDSTYACFSRYAPGTFDGVREDMVIIAKRRAPGVGNFVPTVVDRSPSLPTCIARYDDLVVPVIVYYDYEPEPPTLEVSPTSISMTANSESVSHDTVEVTFTADGLVPVEFTLDWGAAWLNVIDYTGPLTTPATVHVTADATQLLPDVYTDVIDITVLAPADAVTPITEIPVTLTVNPAPVRPMGDLDCDGQLALGDLVVMIYHLFINPSPIPYCE